MLGSPDLSHDPNRSLALGKLSVSEVPVFIEQATAPSLSELRPVKPIRTAGFPVYDDLVDALVDPKQHPDDTVAHVLGVAAGYAYSDAETVSMILARMGLEGNRCLKIAQTVDAMLIESTAYVVQSADGRVVVVAYRGTQPANVLNWLTDADLHPDRILFPFPGSEDPFDIHAGFYRNVRATRYEVIRALLRARDGRSVLPDDDAAVPHPMERLYVAGHSLGGAMAALLGVMLAVETDYLELFGDAFAAVYTYGQPMVGSPAFAKACDDQAFLADRVIRYIYRRDPVPHVPPKDSGKFAHFGLERSYEGTFPWLETSDHPAGQMTLALDFLGSTLGFVAQAFERLRVLPLRYNLNDHLPHHYISALTPPGRPNEYGDAQVVAGS